MAKALQLPIIDLSSSDRISTANSIRQACMDCGFFYVINHGVEEKLLHRAFDESKKFFSLPLKEKMKLPFKNGTGYTPLYAEKLNHSSSSKGDSKECLDISMLESISSPSTRNQWPSDEVLPFWRSTMESTCERVLTAAKSLLSLIALVLNLDEDFFEKVGTFNPPKLFFRILRYPGELGSHDEEICGASAHSDYGMITLLATDGVGGLQVCREKSTQPLIWEDVHHINGAFIVNIGDMTERWTNCLFRSTLHRVMPTGQERYSIALFIHPNPDCVVECLKSCCSDSNPPRFPPIRTEDYVKEKIRLTYGS